jgi:hypothetical protein
MAQQQKSGSKKQNDAGQSTPKYRTAEQEATDRKRAAARKKANAGGRETHNTRGLNTTKDANFLDWARQHPVEACKQADAEAQAGNDHKMWLLKKHRIGQLVDRRPTQKTTQHVAPKPVAEKSTPRRRHSAADIAALQTAANAAKTELTIAQAFHRNQVPQKLAELTKAQKALAEAAA